MSGMFSENPGHMYLRQIEDRFTVRTSTGVEHQCFVFRPAGLTLEEFHRLAPNADVALLKDIIKAMLQALDFLHTEAHIVHTDIKPDNIFFTISSPETIEIFAKRLKGRRPVGRYDATNSRTIYRSTKFTDLLQLDELSLGKPVLGDLSEARIVKTRDPLPPSRTISPLQARAPEICLGLPWKYPVDIWAFAVTVWYILARRDLFSLAPGESSNTKLLAQMTAVLGEPPADFLAGGRGRSPGSRSRSPLAPRGTSRGASPLASPNAASFPASLAVGTPAPEKMDQSSLAGQLEELDWDGKTELLAFMRCMLVWKPEDRSTAASLLQHPFLAKAKSQALAAVTVVEE
nr:serine/threonine-protein kinase srpk [Quercus suber]